MDKEKLNVAISLDMQINRLENYLNNNRIDLRFIKTPTGVEYMDFYDGVVQCFPSDDEDDEDVAKIKGMITEYLNKKLNQYKKEFEEL